MTPTAPAMTDVAFALALAMLLLAPLAIAGVALINTGLGRSRSAAQALLAAKAGAYFVSPFVGRIDDTGWNGMELIQNIVLIYRNYGYATQVLAASLRHCGHVIDAAKAGSHIGTMPFKVMDSLFNHPLTDKGVEQFLKDYDKVFHNAPAAR